ncbi:AraC family transcriptional regulator [Vallitalea okinawensis]|uniref:AraC family transcriptional regulator n=1 Tax=Vallitalea okinawensis TaxID=2078660 RepID=UPI000CFBD067|nr:AraC family transcriptional regulator [Vallitalea okinawensis]
MKIIQYFNTPINYNRLPLYPLSMGTNYTQGSINRQKGYHGFQWLQTLSGEGIFQCNGHQFDLPAGCGIFIDKSTSHHYYSSSDNEWLTAWLVFDGPYAERILSFMELSFFTPYAITDLYLFTSTFEQLSGLSHKNTAKEFMEASTVLYNFLYQSGSALIHTDSPLFFKYKKIEPIIEYINANYSKDLSLETLASLINISPQYFCSIFKSITGLRVFEYINRIRINHAKELLLGTSYSVDQIALMCGYDSSSYFFTLFKKHQGYTPGAFRKMK